MSKQGGGGPSSIRQLRNRLPPGAGVYIARVSMVCWDKWSQLTGHRWRKAKLDGEKKSIPTPKGFSTDRVKPWVGAIRKLVFQEFGFGIAHGFAP